MKTKDGKTGHLAKLLWNLRNSSHDFRRANKWADDLKQAVKNDPGLAFELKFKIDEIDKRLKDIACCRAQKLLASLRDPTAAKCWPESALRADALEVIEMIEKGILAYAELGTTATELKRLAKSRN